MFNVRRSLLQHKHLTEIFWITGKNLFGNLLFNFEHRTSDLYSI